MQVLLAFLFLPMTSASSSTRQRLVQSALELFASQGVTATTTRQIAERAEVNEVTLFRNFGNKYGLLRAVIEESEAFENLATGLLASATSQENLGDALSAYAQTYLQTLQQVPELVRSLIGESGQFPVENRQVLGQRLADTHCHLAESLEVLAQQLQVQFQVSPLSLANLLNSLLLGYAIIAFTTESHSLWATEADFFKDVEQLFAHGAFATAERSPAESALTPQSNASTTNKSTDASATVSPASISAVDMDTVDLSANLVYEILKQARKAGGRDYALAYVLFGAGLSPEEMAGLQRSQHLHDPRQQILQVIQATGSRQIPVNQWILGKRYGSYENNPLTQWLKSRRDSHPALFVDSQGNPLPIAEICACWQRWTQGLLTPVGQPPAIAQAQQTWRVEMLMRGMSLENLSILTGLELVQLQPYARRAKEKTALEQALQLDHKPTTK
jgi:AcrR family transcriptional regulator